MVCFVFVCLLVGWFCFFFLFVVLVNCDGFLVFYFFLWSVLFVFFLLCLGFSWGCFQWGVVLWMLFLCMGL